MDFSKFDTYAKFFKAEEQVYPGITAVEHTVLKPIVNCLVQVRFTKVQEYNTLEREVKTAVLKVQWNPMLEGCTHVETVTQYGTEFFRIEIQQMPFDGEVEMSCTSCIQEIGTFTRLTKG